MIEAVSAGKREVSPDGLTFVEADSPDRTSLSRLAGAATVTESELVLSVPFNGANVLAARFPSASVDLVQTQRIAGDNGNNL